MKFTTVTYRTLNMESFQQKNFFRYPSGTFQKHPFVMVPNVHKGTHTMTPDDGTTRDSLPGSRLLPRTQDLPPVTRKTGRTRGLTPEGQEDFGDYRTAVPP